MDTNRLTIAVRNKVPYVSFGDYIVSDNTDCEVFFDLDSDWDGLAYKTARVIMDGVPIDIAFTGNSLTLPRLPASLREFKIGLYAGELKTTSAAEVRIVPSIIDQTGSISAHEAAELARVRAEAEREAAEAARAQAEAARSEAESLRNRNEQGRIAAETERQNAELTRIGNENTRISQESARVNAEAARADAEAARRDAEHERARADDAREFAEYRRELAESARQDAEEARANAENARAQAESARAAAESQRSSAERARAAAEGEREWSESLRAAAENVRANSENARGAAESARAAAESARASAESAREQSEAFRIQNELDRGMAELAREARVQSIIDDFSEYMQQNDVLDVLALIHKYGARAALRTFLQANAPLVGLDAAVLRFFDAASASVHEVYASTFYRYGTSSSPVGWKEQANADLVCEPSTNETAGRDDYADLPLFACFDCNYTIDAQSLEPVIHAIKDVYGEFSSAPSDSFVGVLQMTGWVRRTQTATTKTLEYAAYRKEAGFRPLPEAVRISDNSVRPFVIHAKYAAGWNSLGRLSSVSGVMPAANRPAAYGGINASHDTQTAKWREWGNQYAGGSICDLAFLQTMLEIKYANLGSWNVMAGSRGYTTVYTAKVSESGVTRVLVTPEEAAYCVVGSTVSIGSGSDRTAAAAYDVCAFARITAINYMTVDGVGYGVVQTDADTPFNVTANETTLLLQPWLTGTTDAVKGSDGSPFDNRSGKEPFKLQGIEVPCMYEVLADVVLQDNPGQGYTVWANRRAENIGSGKGTNAVNIGILRKRGVTGTTTNNITELNWLGTPESYMLVQSSAAGTTPITTGYCAPLTQTSVNTGTGNWRSYRTISGSVNASLAAVFGNSADTSTPVSWADTCRACGTAGNRGVYSE